jgi:hypothetical protein
MNKSTLCSTSFVGALLLGSAFTASCRDQKYSDWSTPINLGPKINSGPVEVQPYISADRETLYFSSNRQGGGPTDICMSTRTKGSGK